jgi:MoaA/NifB/PqqE/SkfB family radical SAM enzyme
MNFTGIDLVFDDSFDVVWDLGRRCTYACTYCGPHHSNKTSPNTSLEVLKHTLDGVWEYTSLLNSYRPVPKKTTLAFTGGEPTVNPYFFDFIKYAKEKYPEIKTNLTTNGCYNSRKNQEIIDNIDSCTVSYHAEATIFEKSLVKTNITAMKAADYNFRVNVMFHKDYFDECVELCNWFTEINVKFTPRVIGDSNNKEDLENGTAHLYNDQQMQWFKDFWARKNEKVNQQAKSCEMASGNIGRPCCAGRNLKLNIDNTWIDGTFVPSNNFQGWNCMVNWHFLFVNSELDGVWHHQTCQVNLEGQIGPIGTASRFDLINENLKNTLESGNMPFIKCPKTYCGCGLCSTKSKSDADAYKLFKSHTKNLEPIFQAEIKTEDRSKAIYRMLMNNSK